jgi:hypothetical protein
VNDLGGDLRAGARPRLFEAKFYGLLPTHRIRMRLTHAVLMAIPTVTKMRPASS